MGLNGMKSLKRKVRHMRDNLHENVTDAVESGADSTARQAKANVVHKNAVWTTNLYRSIGVKRRDGGMVNTVRITADVPYAAYVEFGTGESRDPTTPKRFFFEAPPMTESLFRNIQAWVMQKPAFHGPRTKTIAYRIAKSISEEGTDPHPYMRPAWQSGEMEVKRRAQRAVRKTLKY